MLLPSNKVPEVAKEMLQLLLEKGDIETAAPREVQLDLEAVLNQYLKTELDLQAKARDTLAAQSLPPSEFPKVLKALAEQRKIKIGEEALDYVLEQLVEMLLNSNNVDEVYAEDHDLRRKLRIPLRKQIAAGDDLDLAVRAQIKHVQEGTSVWEVEYKRMMEEMKRRKGL